MLARKSGIKSSARLRGRAPERMALESGDPIHATCTQRLGGASHGNGALHHSNACPQTHPRARTTEKRTGSRISGHRNVGATERKRFDDGRPRVELASK
jgi:hypothetical protein